MWKLNNMLLNDQWITDEAKEKGKKKKKKTSDK